MVSAMLLCVVGTASAGVASAGRKAVKMDFANGPLLSDVAGWNQPKYYATVQTADINGDGQDEIVARGRDGLHAWELVRGAWVESSLLPAVNDAMGLKEPSWYSTLRFARLQPGSAQQDLVVRRGDGVHIWRYVPSASVWTELGPQAGSRPFADNEGGGSGTDWKTVAHYTNILVGDLDGDGVDELIGRGVNGLEVYKWDGGGMAWRFASQNGPLSDAEGFARDSSYQSVQVVVRPKKVAYIVARAPGGVRLLQWNGARWRTLNTDGPFSDDDFDADRDMAKSVTTFVDAQGGLWLMGMVPARGRGSASVAVYQWDDRRGRWSRDSTIDLPGRGWSQPSQYTTLRAGDLWGDGQWQIAARAADGMHLYSRRKGKGGGAWYQSALLRDMSDARGYNMASAYYTIQTVKLTRPDAGSNAVTALMARSPLGVELYKSSLGAAPSKTTPFPAWPNNSQLLAYQDLSLKVTNSTNDVRSVYDSAVNDYTFWSTERQYIDGLKNSPPACPPPPNNQNCISSADWNAAIDQLEIEFGYVAAAHAWFTNNAAVTNYIFSQAAIQLIGVELDETLADSSPGAAAQVALNWTQLAAQIAGQILSVLGFPEASFVSGIIQSGIQAASASISGGNNGVQAEVDQIATQLSSVQNQYTLTNANQLTTYVTDWGLLQQIGVGSTGPNPKYKWGASSDVDEVAAAQVKGAMGQKLWMYKAISNPAWHVYACWPDDWPFGGCTANSSYPSQYIYTQTDGTEIDYTAYITKNAAYFPYPHFDALAALTGNGPNDYNQYINDILSGCNGWDPNDATGDVQPNSCSDQSSALGGGNLVQNSVRLSVLKQAAKITGSGRSAWTSVDAAENYVKEHSRRRPAQFGGAPKESDVVRSRLKFGPRYIDKEVPMQFLTHFVQATKLDPKVSASFGDFYSAQAYDLMGTLNDDETALQTMASPHR